MVLTPTLGMSIPLHTKFFYKRNISKVAITGGKLSNGRKYRHQCLVLDSCITKKLSIRFRFQASFPKLTMLFEARTCDMYLLHSYVPLQLSKSFQVPFNQFSDSFLSKIRVKIWDEESYIGELHAAPTTFRNK